MPNTIHFSEIKNQEDFFVIFQGLCNIAESAFNAFDNQFKNSDLKDTIFLRKHVSYLMSITFVIMGMRGDYREFRQGDFILPFSVVVDGNEYTHAYLYQMNDYFANRFNQVLALLEKFDPESHKSYKTVWRNF